MMKKIGYWWVAIGITLALSIYQRMTGPTHPKKVDIELNGEDYRVKLPRSGVQKDEVISLKDWPEDVKAQMHYRRFPTAEAYTTVDFVRTDNAWHAALPVQPIAGKLEYYLTIDGKDYLKDEPVIIRFRNDVPAYILIPHILLMFGAMLFAVYTLMMVTMRMDYSKWLKITVALRWLRCSWVDSSSDHSFSMPPSVLGGRDSPTAQILPTIRPSSPSCSSWQPLPPSSGSIISGWSFWPY